MNGQQSIKFWRDLFWGLGVEIRIILKFILEKLASVRV